MEIAACGQRIVFATNTVSPDLIHHPGPWVRLPCAYKLLFVSRSRYAVAALRLLVPDWPHNRGSAPEEERVAWMAAHCHCLHGHDLPGCDSHCNCGNCEPLHSGCCSWRDCVPFGVEPQRYLAQLAATGGLLFGYLADAQAISVCGRRIFCDIYVYICIRYDGTV